MSDIFISYARENRNRVELLAKAFEKTGWSVWWDRKIPPGKTFVQVIEEELAGAGCVLVVWSKYSVKSNWVQEEADEGLRRGILIPILIDDVVPPMGYRRIQALDLIEWDPTRGSQNFDFLTENIAQILERPPSAHEAEKFTKFPAQNDKYSGDDFVSLDEPPKISLEELESILEKHSRWIENDSGNGQQANLVNADLSGFDLTGANLTGVDLSGSNLSRTNLQTANLTKANLTGANLISSDLSNANLKNAILIETRFKNANLMGISGLSDTNLTGADFEGARGLLSLDFARSDLSRTKLPEDINKFKTLPIIEDTSKSARKSFMVLISLCALAWLIIAQTTDVALFTNTSSIPLPVVGDKFLPQLLYISVPLVLLFVYVAFHLYMQRNWETLGTLPAIFPDGVSLNKKLSFWFLNCVARRNFQMLESHRSVTSKLEEISAVFLGWWAVPVTLMGMWLRYIPRHYWPLTGLHIIFIVTAIAAALGFYQLSIHHLNGNANRHFGLKSALRNKKIHYGLILGIAGGLLCVLSYGAINGVRSDQPRLTSLTSTVPWLFLKFGYDVFADIREVDVSSKPRDFWSIKKEQDRINSVKGALLKKKDLRYANMFRAFVAKAILRRANLEGANLRKSDFQGADMRQVNLQNTDLRAANLKGADLREATLMNADMVGAQLQNTNLGMAQFRGADLNEVDLENADLRCADLTGAKNLTISMLNSVKTLYHASMDTALLEEVERKMPHLFETPKLWVEPTARKKCP
jgi:uncharacterized protein YjbI with pentapeptide repeats